MRQKISEYILDKLSSFFGSLTNDFMDRFHEEADRAMHHAEQRILNLQRKMIKTATYMSMFILAGILGVVALFYSFKEFLLLGNALSFSVIGVIALIIGIIIRLQLKGGYENYGTRYR